MWRNVLAGLFERLAGRAEEWGRRLRVCGVCGQSLFYGAPCMGRLPVGVLARVSRAGAHYTPAPGPYAAPAGYVLRADGTLLRIEDRRPPTPGA